MDDNENQIVRRLRRLTAVAVTLSLLAIVLGYLKIDALDMHYQPVMVRAGSDELAALAIALVLPASWVYRTPRKRQIVTWSIWFVVVGIGGLILIVATTGRIFDRPDLEMVDEVVPALMMLAHAAGGLVVVVSMPIIRSTCESPPLPAKLPRARIVK